MTPEPMEIVSVDRDALTMALPDVSRFKAGDVVKAKACSFDGPFRSGYAYVLRSDSNYGVVYLNGNGISAMCSGDYLAVWSSATVREDVDGSDHKVLVSYLMSCVRRKDWHGVSDAANDLRVLEAKQGR